jgi:hypothetical protein
MLVIFSLEFDLILAYDKCNSWFYPRPLSALTRTRANRSLSRFHSREYCASQQQQ